MYLRNTKTAKISTLNVTAILFHAMETSLEKNCNRGCCMKK